MHAHKGKEEYVNYSCCFFLFLFNTDAIRHRVEAMVPAIRTFRPSAVSSTPRSIVTATVVSPERLVKLSSRVDHARLIHVSTMAYAQLLAAHGHVHGLTYAFLYSNDISILICF